MVYNRVCSCNGHGFFVVLSVALIIFGKEISNEQTSRFFTHKNH